MAKAAKGIKMERELAERAEEMIEAVDKEEQVCGFCDILMSHAVNTSSGHLTHRRGVCGVKYWCEGTGTC
jgi:hypothetical protein